MSQTTYTEDIDAQSRSRMIEETDTNFFVEAGAGSGKTTMLVSRMVSMIEQGKEISQICAITFTKAAAGEFYSRFQKALAERSQPEKEYIARPGALPPTTELSRSRCARALAEIDLCFMGTIDSFCNMILSEHPSDAGIPSDAALMSDKDAEALYKQEYVRICRGLHGQELKDLATSFRAVHSNPEHVFVRMMSFLMQNRNVDFTYQEGSWNIDQDFQTVRRDLVQALTYLDQHRELAYTKQKDSKEAWEKLTDASRALKRRWSANFSSVLYALKSISKIRMTSPIDQLGLCSSDLFTEHMTRNKFAWTEFAMNDEGKPELLTRLENLKYHATMSFLVHCIPVLEEVMLTRGCLIYFDYLYRLRNLLARDAAKEGLLISYIAKHHSYFLIDEFQDTNPMQAEIFFYLTAEKPTASWQDCHPKPGSLFIVGDPKQSIYRFRSADVTSFLRVKELFRKNAGDVLSLTRNFRSSRELCGYFNQVFRTLLPEETETQSRYPDIPLPAETIQDPHEFGGVYTYDCYSGQGAEEHPDLTDEQQTARMILRLVNNPVYLLRGKEDQKPRRIRFQDFMLITTSKSSLTRYMDCFHALGIPTHTEGKVPFESCQALRTITQVYAAVTELTDTAHLYGVLTGPIFQLSREELITYKKMGGRLSLYRDPDESLYSHKTAQALLQLRQIALAAPSLSPAALFAKIGESFRIYDFVAAEQLEIVCYTQELLRSMEQTGTILSTADALIYLNKLLCGEAEEERCLSLKEQTEAVHLANLHKVKGLEAPIVILASSSPKAFSPEYRISHEADGSKGWIFNYTDSSVSGSVRPKLLASTDFPDQEAAESQALKDERKRLIYVAATRARNALLISRTITIRRGSESISTRWEPLIDAGIRDFFEETIPYDHRPAPVTEQISSSVLYQQAEDTCVFQNRRAEEAAYAVRKPSNDKAASRLQDQLDQLDPAPSFLKTPDQSAASAILHSFPTLLGTMTHRVMEMLVSSANSIDVNQMISEILMEYSTPAITAYTYQLSSALGQVVTTMRSGGYPQQNQASQDLLTELLAAEEVHCEVPFCYKEEEQGKSIVWHGVMDVIYRNTAGWHIIDYKTNADGSNLDAKYQGQMAAYEKAFYTMTGEKARALTYHIDI